MNCPTRVSGTTLRLAVLGDTWNRFPRAGTWNRFPPSRYLEPFSPEPNRGECHGGGAREARDSGTVFWDGGREGAAS